MRKLGITLILMVIGVATLTLVEVGAQPNDPQQELIRAQTEYYKAQKDRLSERIGLWQSLKDNPASTVGILGAIVALISFAFNYRVTLRTQRDTQFYEALKRFGDKDSPTVRASATGLVAQMAITKVFSLKRRRPYFQTALSQLTTGLLLEGNYVALLAIRDALAGLIDLDLMSALKRLYESNLKLQEDACITLAKFCVAIGKNEANTPEEIPTAVWRHAESVTLHKQSVLQYLATKNKELFSYFSVSHRLTVNALSAEQQADNLISAQMNLRNSFNRLDINVELCGQSLRTLSKQGIAGASSGRWKINSARTSRTVGAKLIYDNIFLAKADLSETHLKDIRMRKAQLHEADLSRGRFERIDLQDAQLEGAKLLSSFWNESDLRDTQLKDAEIRRASWSNNTKMAGANWWSANFFDAQNNVSEEQLRGFFKEYLFPKDLDLSEVHASAREYVKERKERIDRN